MRDRLHKPHASLCILPRFLFSGIQSNFFSVRHVSVMSKHCNLSSVESRLLPASFRFERPDPTISFLCERHHPIRSELQANRSEHANISALIAPQNASSRYRG